MAKSVIISCKNKDLTNAMKRNSWLVLTLAFCRRQALRHPPKVKGGGTQ